MKILHINILYDPYLYGGVEHTLRSLVQGMAKRGHDLTVLSTGPEAGLHVDIVDGIKVYRAGVRNLYWLSRRNNPPVWKRALWHLIDVYNPFMKKIVKDAIDIVKPDVVTVHNLTGFSASAWDVFYQAGVPIVQVLHDQYAICPRSTMFDKGEICARQCLSCRLLRLFHPRLSNKVSAVVGASSFVLNHHLQYSYYKESPIKLVIHNARDINVEISDTVREQDGTIRFGFIGTLALNKGVELLLQVFREIALSNWQLHITGRGSDRYDKYLRDSYSAPNVFFHGTQEQAEFYRNVDVVVVPSLLNDTLPGVVFEAFAFCKPVIGSRRGGIPEMLEDNVTGLLFDPNKPVELGAAMIKMVEDTEFRYSASQSARNAAAYYLDSNRFLSSYEKLYYELCRKI